jgi:hypothetical protein
MFQAAKTLMELLSKFSVNMTVWRLEVVETIGTFCKKEIYVILE